MTASDATPPESEQAGTPPQGAPTAGSAGGERMASSPSGPAIVVGLLIAFAAVLLLGFTVRALRDDAPPAAGDFSGNLLPEPRPRPDFTLVDTAGNPFDFAEETAGRLTILFFGYANCPDVCPITLATLDEALGAADGIRADVVFVSVDPARDNPEAIRAYLNRFDSRFVGLTGTPEQLAAAQRAAGVSVAYDSGPNDRGGYDVGHSSQVIVFTPDDLGRLVYGFGVRVDEWAGDLERIRDTGEWWP